MPVGVDEEAELARRQIGEGLDAAQRRAGRRSAPSIAGRRRRGDGPVRGSSAIWASTAVAASWTLPKRSTQGTSARRHRRPSASAALDHPGGETHQGVRDRSGHPTPRAAAPAQRAAAAGAKRSRPSKVLPRRRPRARRGAEREGPGDRRLADQFRRRDEQPVVGADEEGRPVPGCGCHREAQAAPVRAHPGVDDGQDHARAQVRRRPGPGCGRRRGRRTPGSDGSGR